MAILSTGGVTLNGNLAIGTNQAFTLLSTASGTAYVANNGSAVATGAATVQRYITPTSNAGAGYRHYSSPVQGNTVSDFATANFTPSTVKIRKLLGCLTVGLDNDAMMTQLPSLLYCTVGFSPYL